MDYKQSGVDIDAGNEVVRRIRSLARGTFTPGVLSEIGSFGGLFRLGAAGSGRPGARRERRRRRHQAARRVHDRRAHARSAWISSTTASTTSWCRARSRCSFSTIWRPAGWTPMWRCRSSRGSPARAARTDARCSAARPPRCRASTPTASTTSPDSSSASCRARTLIDGRSIAPATCSIGLPSSGLHTNGYSLARRIAFESARLGVDARDSRARSLDRRGAARPASLVPRRSSARCSRGRASSRAWRTSRAEASPTTCRACFRRARTRGSIDRRGRLPPIFRWLQRTGSVPDADMLRTFNMGIGLILACAPDRERELHRRAGRRPASPTRCASARSGRWRRVSC